MNVTTLCNDEKVCERLTVDLVPSGSTVDPDSDTDMEMVSLWTQPQTRQAWKPLSNSQASRSRSCGRTSPRVVDFKSPPRAVFKSSRAARQARALSHIELYRHTRAAACYSKVIAVATHTYLSQAVVTRHVTCLALSDKAASAHVVAMSAGLPPGRFQGYEPEPTGVSPPRCKGLPCANHPPPRAA